MSEWLFALLGLATGVLLGVLGTWLRLRLVSGPLKTQARRVLEEAEIARERRLRDAEIDAKEAALSMQEEHDRIVKVRKNELLAQEKTLRQRESKVEGRSDALESRERQLKEREAALAEKAAMIRQSTDELEAQRAAAAAELQRIGCLTQAEAKDELLQRVELEVQGRLAAKLRRIEEQSRKEASERAMQIVAASIQRYAGEFIASAAVSVVELPSDDMKGRIIGREGRNIRAIEAATGVDIIIDDTPEVVVISAFNPMRREVARLALEQLVVDGRIHPARIEEVVAWAKGEVAAVITRAGEQATFELGLHGIHPELLQLVGKLKLRSIGGQNLWSHSLETAHIAGMMADELGLNASLAKRAGLLHDIGKALDQEVPGHHAHIAAEQTRRCGEKPAVVEAIRHYHEHSPSTVYGVLLQAADRLSMARPGVRREVLDSYIKRLHDLERLSLSFDGVAEAFALQAGREVRVMVNYDEISEDGAFMLSQNIAKQIEETLTYPGEVQVTVVREARVTEIAR